MRRRLSKWILIVVVAGALGATWSALEMSSYADSPMAQAEEIRDDLREIRSQLNSCLGTQNRMEARFRTVANRTEGLRAQVDEFEAMDPDGVPAQFYDEYLGLVEEYNESIPEWERQADSLREYASGCRTLVEIHNRWADSLRQALVETGVWDESWATPTAERVDPQLEVEETPIESFEEELGAGAEVEGADERAGDREEDAEGPEDDAEDVDGSREETEEGEGEEDPGP